MRKNLTPVQRHALRLLKHGAFTEPSIQLYTGLTPTEIRGLRRSYKLDRVQKWDERNTLSKMHWELGNRLVFVRMLGGNLTTFDISHKLQWTDAKYRRVERGIYPLELLDLQQLAKLFNCGVAEIITCQFGD